MALRKRDEQPFEHTWAVESVFGDEGDWDSAYQALEARIPELESFRGRLAESPKVLLDWMTRVETLDVEAGRLLTYANMRHDADTGEPAGAARWQQANGLAARVAAAASFHETEIAGIGREALDRFTAEEPGLQPYRHHFERILRRSKHIRSAEVEEVLALASDPLSCPFMAHTGLVDADLKYGTVSTSLGEETVAQGTISALLENPDREVRRQAWERYADGYLSVKTTVGFLLAGEVKSAVFRARARRYGSSREAALERNFIPGGVFDSVLAAFREHLPVWHRYWRARKKALGLEQLRTYDIWAPLTLDEPQVSYDQAIDWLVAGMSPLGDEYVVPMRRGLLEERWVDVFPNVGKRGGAYSGGSHATRPFVLMNWVGGMGDMSTLAHELGHSMHSYLSRETQQPLYSDYSLFCAEVASNFNQALLRAYLLRENQDPAFQIAVIGEAMANFHRYLFIMPILELFEDEIHRRVEAGEGLTAESMSALMVDLLREGYGGEVAIDEARDGITWAQFPHLFMNFYVYQYATGISAANALAEQVLEGGDSPRRYTEFLRAGGSVYPLDALKLAGVDMASPEPVRAAFRVLEGFVERLERLVSA